MDSEAVFLGLLDRLSVGLRKIGAYEKYVVTCAIKKESYGEDDDDWVNKLSDEQFAAMFFWRMTGAYIVKWDRDPDNENREILETANTNDDEIEDWDDQDQVNHAFSKWLIKFEKDDLPELLKNGNLSEISDNLMGIYNIGIEVGENSYIKTVDMKESTNTKASNNELPILSPLSDAKVDAILRKARGYGMRR